MGMQGFFHLFHFVIEDPRFIIKLNYDLKKIDNSKSDHCLGETDQMLSTDALFLEHLAWWSNGPVKKFK